MSDTKPPTERQAPSDLVARIAAELRGPGAACLMSERDSTDAAIGLIDALADAGYVIVPREPTAAMTNAGNSQTACWSEEPNYIWRAMVGAAG